MRVRRILKRCTATVLTAVMLTVGVGIPVVDAHAVTGSTHIEPQSNPACSSPQHNHSLCEFLAATPVLAASGGFPEFARTRELTIQLPGADAVFASVTILRPNSRSPPVS